MLDFNGGPVEGDLDVQWIHGSRSKERADPPLQVHHCDEHTVILRQSKDVTFEAPFLFLLFGRDRALLLDTGATKDPKGFPLRETVDALVSAWLDEQAWLDERPRSDYELVVAHTHAHGDHVAGDAQFADRPHTRVIGKELEEVRSFFGFTDWPEQVVTCDLGGRVLELTGIPGHHATSVAVFDPWTGFLLTGDTVYPGRLYGFDMPALAASLERLVDFAEARPVTHVLGCHIEMTRESGRDYPMGARYQPDEPPLQMTMDQLRAVRDATQASAGKTGIFRHDDFIIVSGMGVRNVVPLLLRSWRHRLGQRLGGRR